MSSDSKGHPLSVSVVVASLGRPENLSGLLKRLSLQTQLPRRVILSIESPEDAPKLEGFPFPVECIAGPRGMCAQRNRGLGLLGDETSIVIFYDDDFVPSKFSIERVSQFFEREKNVAGACGDVLADGVTGSGITPEKAEEIVVAYDQSADAPDYAVVQKMHGLYGCNMAYRMSMIEGIRFDENLPLYAWLEDLDFGGRITAGDLVKTRAFAGVHCGEKRGREKKGRILGYSQIANPIYMANKGSLSWSIALRSVFRLFVANHVLLLRPKPWVDRKGRMIGNWIAVMDMLRGRLNPCRILELLVAGK